MRKTSYRSSGSTSGDLSREDPSVDTARGPRHDRGYPDLLQGRRREDTSFDVVLAHHHGGVETFDVQAPLGVLVRGVRGHEVDVRQVVRELLRHFLSLVYSEHFVSQRVEGADHGEAETSESDDDELPPHRPPTWIAGRRSGFGSASRSTSWVTGAVSPSPKRMKRIR